MSRMAEGVKDSTCEDIANSLVLFFSDLKTGPCNNKLIMFDDVSYPYDMKGDSFCDRIMNLPRVGCGGTNFQSAVEEIIKIRKEHPEIPLEQYPTTILVVSDMQFNPVSYGWRSKRTEPTNYEYSVKSLKTVFPAEFVDNMKFIWWDCASKRTQDFAATINDSGCYFFSGFDGSIISMPMNEDAIKDEVTGEVRRPTAEELVAKALNQEILTYVKL